MGDHCSTEQSRAGFFASPHGLFFLSLSAWFGNRSPNSDLDFCTPVILFCAAWLRLEILGKKDRRKEGRKEGGQWLQTPSANCNVNYKEFLEAEQRCVVLPGTGTHRVTPDVSSPVPGHRTHTVTALPCFLPVSCTLLFPPIHLLLSNLFIHVHLFPSNVSKHFST